MWTTIIALLESTLKIVQMWLTWQVALTKINARKLAYDIDQEQTKAGADLLRRIDAARGDGDLVATSLLLNDQANASLFAADFRSSLPDGLTGTDLGLGGGVPEVATPVRQPYNSLEPVASPNPSLAVASNAPARIIPVPPYAVTGMGTWFGLNPNGSNDTGDVNAEGENLLGAFGDDCHNKTIVGLSIPILIFRATIGATTTDYADVRKRRYLFDVFCHATGKHATGVWLVDLGPNASLNRPLDMTYALGTMLGLKTNGICTWWCTDTQTKEILEIKGWDFVHGKNLS
jgi:hypothetical protein